LEEEQARIRREKDVETERMRTLQERAIDVRVEQDALRAKRGQEQTEREWRRKEEMLAVQRAQNEEMIKKARVRQQEEKQHLQAIEAQRDRADFERMLKFVYMNLRTSLFATKLAAEKHENRRITSGYAMWFTAAPKPLKIQVFWGSPSPQGSYSPCILGDTTRPGHVTYVLV